jgi:hypothetical protein
MYHIAQIALSAFNSGMDEHGEGGEARRPLQTLANIVLCGLSNLAFEEIFTVPFCDIPSDLRRKCEFPTLWSDEPRDLFEWAVLPPSKGPYFRQTFLHECLEPFEKQAIWNLPLVALLQPRRVH